MCGCVDAVVARTQLAALSARVNGGAALWCVWERRWERGVTGYFCDMLSLLINMLSSLFVVCVLRV